MIKVGNKIISILLLFILIFSDISNYKIVLALDSEERSKNFLTFTQNKDSLDIANLTTNDYYTMIAFMSNWFIPGVTTLADVIGTTGGSNNSSDTLSGAFFEDFSSYFGMSGNESLKNIVNTFGNDILNGLNTGDCTLIMGNDKICSGVDFFDVMTNGLFYNPETQEKINEIKNKSGPVTNALIDLLYSDSLQTSKVYYGIKNESHIAFDFSSPAVKAAFQTIAAVNPDMFFSSKGIQSISMFYLDSVGNLWGAKSGAIAEGFNIANPGTKAPYANTLRRDDAGLKNIYLILPACLNPSTFSPNISNQKDLRMPLMNRFVLSAVLTQDTLNVVDEGSQFQSHFIPIYDLVESVSNYSVNKNALKVFGLSCLSPYTFNTGDIGTNGNTWSTSQRKKKYADFAFNPQSFVIDGSRSDNGIAKYDSYEYIVFSLSPSKFDYNNGGADKGSIDANEGFLSLFGTGNLAMSVYNGVRDPVVLYQQRLMAYLCTPTILHLNQVSMNAYTIDENCYDASNEQQDAASQFASYLSMDREDIHLQNGEEVLSLQDGALTSSEVSKMGLSGINLFLDDLTLYKTDKNSTIYYVTPQSYIPSRLYQLLWDNLGSIHNSSNYKAIMHQNKKLGGTKTLSDYLFLRETIDNPLMTIDKLNTAFENNNITLIGNKGNFSDYLPIFQENELYFTNTTNADLTNENSKIDYLLRLSVSSVINFGDKNKDVALGSLLGINDGPLYAVISATTNGVKDAIKNDNLSISVSRTNITEYILALYGYSLFTPGTAYNNFIQRNNVSKNITVFGEECDINKKSKLDCGNFSNTYMAGVYLGYIVDMMGLGTCDKQAGVSFGSFKSPFLPRYNISAKGGTLNLSGMLQSSSGVETNEDLSFEQKQKDLINRIYGLTNDSNNDYRNSLIKNIIEGFILTVHRTITGTWGSGINTITTGSSNTYQSVTGYIYTPTLEELPFTATLMNNYIKIYIICMLIILFLLVLLVLLHMRTWQQGVITGFIMFVALLFPYILISNTINISNKISNNIYSDRFDFWALTEHFESMQSLKGSEFMTESEKWLVNSSATNDSTLIGKSGIKIKWMSPKKVDEFQNLYSNSSYNQTFATNLAIFKWLFSSTIYDTEYVDVDTMGSFVYRSYKNIALEAESYFQWGKQLINGTDGLTVSILDLNHNNYSVSKGLQNTFNILGEDKNKVLLSAVGRQDSNLYLNPNDKISLSYSTEKLEDINTVSQYDRSDSGNLDSLGDLVGVWGIISSEVTDVIAANNLADRVTPGIYSNLPGGSSNGTYFNNTSDYSPISKAIYLKNTESPFYYFYSVLKMRYGNGENSGQQFREALLSGEVFKVKNTNDYIVNLNNSKNVMNAYRDFLDMEGLFEYIIPYLKLSNDYVTDWQEANKDMDIETYNFDYSVFTEEENRTQAGEVKLDDLQGINKDGTLGNLYSNSSDNVAFDGDSGAYKTAVENKNAMNRVWNMYSPWVDALYDLKVGGKRVSVGGKTLHIEDTLNPSSYIEQGRPMIFSEADMIVKGYSYKDLTDVERRIQAVTEKTYKDLMYLINYYDMDDEVLLCAAAMYATFNFNTEFSQDSFLGNSVMLYPQGFELKNFNYDAFMRLALLNSTGESVFATEDLYERVLAKTSLFTGLALLVCDLIACVLIPVFKFIMIVGLLFLGILICITCVVNPPEKIFEAVLKSLLLPTIAFMSLNIAFSWVMSLVVGEGLTAYVGSKTVNFVTNDPTMTMLLMAFLGLAYVFVAWQIIKLLISAYKQFGMGTVLATVGIVGSAIAAGTAGIAKRAAQVTGRGISTSAAMAYGAVTAEKGHRLEGMEEGARYGVGGLRDMRRAERRQLDREKEVSSASTQKIVDAINQKASTSESSEGANTSNSSNNNSENRKEDSNNSNKMPSKSSLDSKFDKNSKNEENKEHNESKKYNENKTDTSILSSNLKENKSIKDTVNYKSKSLKDDSSSKSVPKDSTSGFRGSDSISKKTGLEVNKKVNVRGVLEDANKKSKHDVQDALRNDKYVEE